MKFGGCVASEAAIIDPGEVRRTSGGGPQQLSAIGRSRRSGTIPAIDGKRIRCGV